MRVKRAVHARKRKKAYFEAAKGYRGGRSRLWRTVKDAVERSREYSFRDRKARKRDFRRLWITRINAAVREHGMNYSQFIHALQRAEIDLDRKALAHIAMEEPEMFAHCRSGQRAIRGLNPVNFPQFLGVRVCLRFRPPSSLKFSIQFIPKFALSGLIFLILSV